MRSVGFGEESATWVRGTRIGHAFLTSEGQASSLRRLSPCVLARDMSRATGHHTILRMTTLYELMGKFRETNKAIAHTLFFMAR